MNKNLNEISLEDLKSSPYFILTCFVLVILVVVGLISYSIYYIFGIKQELVDTRKSYSDHLLEIATLEELKAQSQKAEEQLLVYKEVLPDGLGDVYVLAENAEKLCNNFNLKVVAFDEPSEEASDTKETVLNLTVEGSFTNIINFMQYISTLRQIHRVDAITLNSDGEGLYTAEMTIAVLSQDGASGLIAPVE
ncbi:MAG: type 4a pilus biogenesis protein PilO [Clostridia bacterium]|nr:type 4a pilus biogenesis protein PilO [Clostridia bacterium]